MTTLFIIAFANFFCLGYCLSSSSISAKDMQKHMGIGINLGNTLDAPVEGNWAPKAEESFFDEYKSKGFTNVRIPIQWGHHMSETAPYNVDESFMDRVAEVVGWSVSRGLITVINTHHDEWFEDSFDQKLPQFESLWTQISTRFANYSNSELLFEIYNEPHASQFTVDDLNEMNEKILPIIRKTNPERIVLLGGLRYMNPSWITSNPDALILPEDDEYIMLEIHNYDPYKYAGMNPSVHSWGSDADIAALNAWMDAIAQWSSDKNIPIYYGEFGCTTDQTKETGRYEWYKRHREAVTNHSFAAAVWDDDGKYRVYDRQNNSWDEDLLNALGKR